MNLCTSSNQDHFSFDIYSTQHNQQPRIEYATLPQLQCLLVEIIATMSRINNMSSFIGINNISKLSTSSHFSSRVHQEMIYVKQSVLLKFPFHLVLIIPPNNIPLDWQQKQVRYENWTISGIKELTIFTWHSRVSQHQILLFQCKFEFYMINSHSRFIWGQQEMSN